MEQFKDTKRSREEPESAFREVAAQKADRLHEAKSFSFRYMNMREFDLRYSDKGFSREQSLTGAEFTVVGEDSYDRDYRKLTNFRDLAESNLKYCASDFTRWDNYDHGVYYFEQILKSVQPERSWADVVAPAPLSEAQLLKLQQKILYHIADQVFVNYIKRAEDRKEIPDPLTTIKERIEREYGGLASLGNSPAANHFRSLVQDPEYLVKNPRDAIYITLQLAVSGKTFDDIMYKKDDRSPSRESNSLHIVLFVDPDNMQGHQFSPMSWGKHSGDRRSHLGAVLLVEHPDITRHVIKTVSGQTPGDAIPIFNTIGKQVWPEPQV